MRFARVAGCAILAIACVACGSSGGIAAGTSDARIADAAPSTADATLQAGDASPGDARAATGPSAGDATPGACPAMDTVQWFVDGVAVAGSVLPTAGGEPSGDAVDFYVDGTRRDVRVSLTSLTVGTGDITTARDTIEYRGYGANDAGQVVSTLDVLSFFDGTFRMSRDGAPEQPTAGSLTGWWSVGLVGHAAGDTICGAFDVTASVPGITTIRVAGQFHRVVAAPPPAGVP